MLAVNPDDADAVVAALAGRDTPAAVAGRVEPGAGADPDGEDTSRPGGDASWPVYERLLTGR